MEFSVSYHPATNAVMIEGKDEHMAFNVPLTLMPHFISVLQFTYREAKAIEAQINSWPSDEAPF